MRFFTISPNENGQYCAIQNEQNRISPPDGCVQVADGVELTCGGFGVPTIENGIMTAWTGDEAAWAAWKAANPTIEEVSPDTDRDNMLVDHEYRLSLLELGV